MRALRWALPALAVLFFSGCFQTFTLIRVNRDGSGTLEERFLLGTRFADMLRSLNDPEGREGSLEGREAGARDPEKVDLERLRARAAGMGAGVQLEQAEPVRTETGVGYRAVFRFTDVNLLELRYNPAENLSELSGEETASPEPIRFRLTRGPTTGLEILLPPAGEGQSSGQAAAGEPEEGTLHMLRQVYGEMKIRLALEVDGEVTESDAAYREGSTVTLIDLDFGRLLQDEQAFRRIAAAQPRGLEELKILAAGNPALRIETGRSVRVRFR